MKPADVAWPLRERNSLEISTRVEGTKHVQVGSEARSMAKRFGCPCQNPPSTKTANRQRVYAISGFPGSECKETR